MPHDQTPVNDETRTGLAPYLWLLVGSVCISFSPVFVKFSDIGPTAAGFWRMAVGGP